MAKKYRADQVGSFLRPPAIKEAHTAYTQGKLSEEELRKVEDREILHGLTLTVNPGEVHDGQPLGGPVISQR